MSSAALIVPCKSSIIYSNQVGGYANNHPEVEGVLVPISTTIDYPTNVCKLNSELQRYFFDDPKWEGRCCYGIDIETADHLDALFKEHRHTEFLRVDREKLGQSMEAWIYLTLNYPNDKCKPYSGIKGNTAILTWPNSD